ncbi:hypothetical protein [Corynebacterium sp.]|uniref:hypothetical protein n=1 Tax=Corynebacterium sp. TaxID=1720 RepID=UPI002586E913|nr:hypothetical protein [Corynebacterium sp.]
MNFNRPRRFSFELQFQRCESNCYRIPRPARLHHLFDGKNAFVQSSRKARVNQLNIALHGEPNLIICISFSKGRGTSQLLQQWVRCRQWINVHTGFKNFIDCSSFGHSHMKLTRKFPIFLESIPDNRDFLLRSTCREHGALNWQLRILRLVSRGGPRSYRGERGLWDSRGGQYQAGGRRDSNHRAAGTEKHHRRHLIFE